MMMIIIIILLLLWFVFFLRSSSLTLCNSYSIAFTLLNCKWSLSSIMPSDSDPTFSDNGPHKEQSWYPHAHGNKKTTSPILNDISWYILISIRNSYSKISSLSKQPLKKNKKNILPSDLHAILPAGPGSQPSRELDGFTGISCWCHLLLQCPRDLQTMNLSNCREYACGGIVENTLLFISCPILGNARENFDFQAPSNACSPICGSDPYGYNNCLVTCIDIQLWLKVPVCSRVAKETSEVLSELSSFGCGRTFYLLQNVFTPCTSSFLSPSKTQSQC